MILSSWTKWTGRAAAGVLVTLLAGCGGGDGDASAGSTSESEVQAVERFMRDRYLWSDQVPAADLSGVSTAEAALDALRARPIDRYSFVEARTVAEAFFDQGQTVGLGIGYATTDANEVVLRFVQPASPAAAAGLARGDRIVAIDGRPVAELISAGTLGDAFGAPRAGVTVTLRVERPAGPIDVPVTKAAYAYQSVQSERVIANGARRVGYVYFSSFVEPARTAWPQALARLAADGAQDLVIDLRDNGGGRLGVAAAVAGTLAPSGAAGQPFWHVRFNAKHAASNYSVAVGANPDNFAFDLIVMLTSGTTCSASELLAFGLRPYRGVDTIGTATCGKPVGFLPQPVGADKLLNAVTFGGANRDADAAYFDGLPPRCAAVDDRRKPLGDPDDPLVAAALSWLRDSRCPAGDATQPKAAQRQPTWSTRPWRGPVDWMGLR